MNLCNLINLIKTITFCNRTLSIDLLRTNQKYSLKNANAFGTSRSNHHVLIYSMLKTSFKKNEWKRLVYRDYTFFSQDSFSTNQSNSNENYQCYETFETKKIKPLDKHAPRKTNLVRGNHKPHVSKKPRKDMMKISQLKSIANNRLA